MITKHTPKQIENWRQYEIVRQGGRYNMVSPQARSLTGLNVNEYMYCLKNYSSLRNQAAKTKKENHNG